jgi:opacity protein-like surface antigen
MKKAFRVMGIAFLVFCFVGSLSAQIQKPSKPFTIEVGLNFGTTLGYDITDSSYTDSWSTYWFQVTESGEIVPELSTPLCFGGNISLITRMGLGVQFALDYNFNSDVTGTSSYLGTGYDISAGNFSFDSDWDITGTAKLMVLSLNVLYKYQGGMFNPWFAAGGSYYTGSLEANTMAGYGIDYFSYFCYFDVDEDVNEDLSGIGFNVGAGADINFTPNIAFTIEGRYFILKKYEMYWMTDATGTRGLYGFYEGTVTLTSSYADSVSDYLYDLITPFEFNPSFLKLAAGVKISF